jgi:hypothetical protein
LQEVYIVSKNFFISLTIGLGSKKKMIIDKTKKEKSFLFTIKESLKKIKKNSKTLALYFIVKL